MQQSYATDAPQGNSSILPFLDKDVVVLGDLLRDVSDHREAHATQATLQQLASLDEGSEYDRGGAHWLSRRCVAVRVCRTEDKPGRVS